MTSDYYDIKTTVTDLENMLDKTFDSIECFELDDSLEVRGLPIDTSI